jgi:hypothetical protein
MSAGSTSGPLAKEVLVGALVAIGACSSSVLVRPDDATYMRATQRLDQTGALVDEIRPPTVDRAIFLQAESFYRYRFAPPPRRTSSYVAEVGAAVTDFPALQSLAGSLDLLDLRLRSYDAAVQLWETLLANHPKTSLRPLTLYRLGWAYRSSGAAGLPRNSGDEAFDTLIQEVPGTPLAVLAIDAKKLRWKSKASAAEWSVVPGLGQFYVGEKLSGTVRLTIALAAFAAIVMPIYVGYARRSDLTWSGDWPLLAMGLGGLVALSIDYTSSYEDAIRGVVEFNERAEALFEETHPNAP